MSKLHEKFISPSSLSGLDEGSPVLVAFSGGADSTALLNMLAEYGNITGARIYAAHVNHMIRGEEADRDEAFCRETAKNLGVEIFILRYDVPAYASQSGKSVETAARDVRYGFFSKLMKEHGIPLLATAHNANDNLETMIFNMARGCGLRGVCGIPDTRRCEGGTVVRPILGMSRREILEYCKKYSLEYVTDSTNVDTDYTRNMIRAEIIPALEGINGNAIENASRLSESLKNDALCLEGMTDWFLDEMNEDMSFECEKILGSPKAIANRALMALFDEISGGGSLEAVHVDAIRELCRTARPHSVLNLPCEVDARIEQGKLYFEKRRKADMPSEDFEITLSDGINFISDIHTEIIIGNSQNQKNVYKKSILLYLDSDKICGSLKARNRRAGDKIRSGGMSKSVKKLLCDKKIPLDIRYRLPILFDDEGLVAVPLCCVRDGAEHKGKADPNSRLCVKINLL